MIHKSHPFIDLSSMYFEKTIENMEELIFISLFTLVPLFLICFFHCCWLYHLYVRRQNTNIDSPPPYDEVVLSKKHLPKFKDIV